MNYSNSKTLLVAMLGLVTATIAGCGNDETSTGSGGTWFDADPVKDAYAGQLRLEAIEAGRSEVDGSCEAVLPLARRSLSDFEGGTVAQIMYRLCSNAELEFQNEIRCEADRLQILCR